jgi:hypothetical protein
MRSIEFFYQRTPKAGFDYNAYENWLDMENIISIGLRYGFSGFKNSTVIKFTMPLFWKVSSNASEKNSMD